MPRKVPGEHLVGIHGEIGCGIGGFTMEVLPEVGEVGTEVDVGTGNMSRWPS